MKRIEEIDEEQQYLKERLEELGYSNTFPKEQKILSRLLVLATKQLEEIR